MLIIAIVIAAAVFCAIIISLAFDPKVIRRMIGASIIVSGVAGLLFYSAGYCAEVSSASEAVTAALRAVGSTIAMFGGGDDFGGMLDSAEWFRSSSLLQILFWLVHLTAIYATASALLATLGKRLVRHLRGYLLPLGRVLMIYGVSADTLRFASDVSEKSRCRIVFVDKSCSEEDLDEMTSVGGVFWEESILLGGTDGKWLRKLGISARRGRRLEVVTLLSDDMRTQIFLNALLKAAKNRGVPSARLHFAVGCLSEAGFAFLEGATDSDYGLEPASGGVPLDVDIFTRSELAARELIHAAPPCLTLDFSDFSAQQDFHAMIIGFGSTGQAVLRRLIANGQFNGSSFSAIVVDPCVSEHAGAFRRDYAYMLSQYHVDFEECSAFSDRFAQLLQHEAPLLRYIVICTGDEKADSEISNIVYEARMNTPACEGVKTVIAQCGHQDITITDGTRGAHDALLLPLLEKDISVRSYPLLDPENILYGRLDETAIALNAHYAAGQSDGAEVKTAPDALKLWAKTQGFSRRSSKASGEYIIAHCIASGASVREASDIFYNVGSEEAERDGSTFSAVCGRLTAPGAELALSKQEHLRWMAFMASAGVTPLTIDEMKRRDEENASLPISERLCLRKDIPPFGIGGRHLCMVSWDELRGIGEAYEKCLNKGKSDPEHEDFQKTDGDLIRAIPQILEQYSRIAQR